MSAYNRPAWQTALARISHEVVKKDRSVRRDVK